MGAQCIRVSDPDEETGGSKASSLRRLDAEHDSVLQLASELQQPPARGSDVGNPFQCLQCRCARGPDELELILDTSRDEQAYKTASDYYHVQDLGTERTYSFAEELSEVADGGPTAPTPSRPSRDQPSRLPETVRSLSRSSPQAKVKWTPDMAVPVFLHIYDVGMSSEISILNRLLRPLNAGVFHCGVEVFGIEYSYSDTTTGVGSGVFHCRPRLCDGHRYCETVRMGKTPTPEHEVEDLIQLLSSHWPVVAYDTLTRNCCHFCNEFCQRLGVGSIPKRVMNLASAGAAIAASGDTTCCRSVAEQCCGSGARDTPEVTLTTYKVISN
mmetsp:Transcript_56143/g.180181  ORF Transcript_56143/g.180181 Transcript_56143/m.180181 type:complete len:327 (+) Transcript_56143:66-1046(+)